ncbi:MAG: protein-glutamate O-methyltransferase CheR [Sandaracinaceae bacterium]
MKAAANDYIRSFVRERSAIVLDEGKDYLVESRLSAVRRARGLADMEALASALRRAPTSELGREVVEALTTNETSFFRDSSCFDALTGAIIPEIIETKRAERTIDIWCGASSTGQEPYSIAMLLADRADLAGWRIRIFATDLDEQVLAKARSGEYSALEINRGLPAAQLAKHFTEHNGVWTLRDRIRSMVTFEQLNLARPWRAFGPMDLVLIRNVLIYFDLDTRSDVIARARRVMRSGAYLLLGGAETAPPTPAYERVRVGRTVAYRAV